MSGSIQATDDHMFRADHRPRRRQTIGHNMLVASFLPIFVVIEAGNRIAAGLADDHPRITYRRSLLQAALAEAKIAVSYVFIGRDMMK